MQNLSNNTSENQNGATDAPRTPAELVAELMAESPMTGRVGGYRGYKVQESARNHALFAAWYDALPADLSGLDLAPLYAIAEDEQFDMLKRRERDWVPVAPLGEECTAPISEDGTPLRSNVRKWESAKEKHANRFRSDLKLMAGGDVPAWLRDAAEGLTKLALYPEGETEDDGSPWDDCQGAADVAATAAALRLCMAALGEIETEAADVARATVARLRRELAKVESVGQLAKGAN